MVRCHCNFARVMLDEQEKGKQYPARKRRKHKILGDIKDFLLSIF